jgi:hypothetical protein
MNAFCYVFEFGIEDLEILDGTQRGKGSYKAKQGNADCGGEEAVICPGRHHGALQISESSVQTESGLCIPDSEYKKDSRRFLPESRAKKNEIL